MQIQEKHKQKKKSKQERKKRWERIPAENEAPEIAKEDKRTKVRSETSI